jgi:hypothetical protein
MHIVEQTSCTRSLVNTTKSSGTRGTTLRFCFGSSVLNMMASVEGLYICVLVCLVDWPGQEWGAGAEQINTLRFTGDLCTPHGRSFQYCCISLALSGLPLFWWQWLLKINWCYIHIFQNISIDMVFEDKSSSKISSLHSLELTFHHKVHIPKMSLVQCWPFDVFSTIYLPQGHVSSVFHFGRFETVLVMQSCHYECSNFWWQHQIILFPLTKGTHTLLGRLNCFEFNLIFICLHITLCSMVMPSS